MITLKEEFVGGDKWSRAVDLGGSDAIVMWLALKRYAAAHLTGGFVPEEEVSRLPGAPKKPARALEALLRCGRINPSGERGDGLVERTQHGWLLHDYADHANSQAEEELRREKERERKRAWRASQERELEELRRRRDSETGQSGTIDGTGRDNGTGQEPDSPGTPRPQARTPAPARTQARFPNPTQPNPTSEEKKEKVAKAPRAPKAETWTVFPPTYEPEPEHVAIAVERGLDLPMQLRRLRAYTFSKPHSDPKATLTKWLLSSYAQPETHAASRIGGVRAGDLLDRQMQRIATMEAAELAGRSLP